MKILDKVHTRKMIMKHIVIVAVVLFFSLLSMRCDDGPVDEQASLTLLTPNGGERWQIGIIQTISWSSKNISGDLKIEISYDDGITFSTLLPGTPNDGEERWYVTGSVSTQVVIRVSSLNETNISDASDNVFEVFEVLPGPKNLLATVVNNRNIYLQWQQQSNNETGFIIERKTGVSGVWSELARTGTDSVTYSDNNLVANRQYFYRVRAYTNDGVSGETNSISKIIGWIQQTSGTTMPLFGVSYPTPTTGIAVGQHGTILRTTNGGDEWSAVASGTTNVLYGVSFGNANVGVAVGAQGTILRTNDGGGTWSAQTFGGENYYFKGVDFSTASNVYIVGYYNSLASNARWGIILRSVDGGINWSRSYEEQRYDFDDVSFVGQNIGTVVGDFGTGSAEAIFHTTNGGQIWFNQSDTTNARLLSVHFLDVNTGTAVGIQGTIVKTVNGGATWTDQSLPVLKTLRKVAYTDVLRGMVVGDDGMLYRTTDGGASWISRPTGFTNHFDGLFLRDANTQTIVGSEGIILRTDNGGQ